MTQNRVVTALIALVLFVVVAGAMGHFLWSGTAQATGNTEVAESVALPATFADADGDIWTCEGERSAENCTIGESEGNAIFEPLGYPSRAGALANCPNGTVGEIWRKGEVAGWACDMEMVGVAQ